MRWFILGQIMSGGMCLISSCYGTPKAECDCSKNQPWTMLKHGECDNIFLLGGVSYSARDYQITISRYTYINVYIYIYIYIYSCTYVLLINLLFNAVLACLPTCWLGCARKHKLIANHYRHTQLSLMYSPVNPPVGLHCMKPTWHCRLKARPCFLVISP